MCRQQQYGPWEASHTQSMCSTLVAFALVQQQMQTADLGVCVPCMVLASGFGARSIRGCAFHSLPKSLKDWRAFLSLWRPVVSVSLSPPCSHSCRLCSSGVCGRMRLFCCVLLVGKMAPRINTSAMAESSWRCCKSWWLAAQRGHVVFFMA